MQRILTGAGATPELADGELEYVVEVDELARIFRPDPAEQDTAVPRHTHAPPHAGLAARLASAHPARMSAAG